MDLAQDHFALFGLPRRQALDAEQLELRYRDIQARVHPDKHAHLPDGERRMAMQWATLVNEAYQTLKDPLKRARYLLHLIGYDARLETNTAMPSEFLLAQIELREAVAAARESGDAAALDALHRRLRADVYGQLAELETLLDTGDYERAGELVRQLMFQEKLLYDIDAALESVAA